MDFEEDRESVKMSEDGDTLLSSDISMKCYILGSLNTGEL